MLKPLLSWVTAHCTVTIWREASQKLNPSSPMQCSSPATAAGYNQIGNYRKLQGAKSPMDCMAINVLQKPVDVSPQQQPSSVFYFEGRRRMVEWRGKNANIAFSALKMIHYSNAHKKTKKNFSKENHCEILMHGLTWLHKDRVKTIWLFISFHI